MSLSLGIGLGITQQQQSSWIGEYNLDGVDPVFAADFAGGRYYNQGAKTFAEMFTESGTTIDSDGIHITAGDSLRTIADGSLPFTGYDKDEGTFVFVGNFTNTGSTAYMLVGDVSTRFVYQTATAGAIKSYDGTSILTKSGVHTDGVTTAIVMSYKSGANFNILADGSTESSAALTGDLATTVLDLGQQAVANNMVGYINRLLWYPTQFSLSVRQGVSV